MEFAEGKEAPLSVVPLTMFLLPHLEFPQPYLSIVRQLYMSMNRFSNWIQAFGDSNEIEDTACHNKDFNHFLSLLLDLIYDLRHFFDHILYDFTPITVDNLLLLFQLAEPHHYSELRSDLLPSLQIHFRNFIKLRDNSKKRCVIPNGIFGVVTDHGIRRKINVIRSVQSCLPPPRQLSQVKPHQQMMYNRQTFSNLEDLVVIGRQKEKEKILDWLSLGIKSGDNFSIIALVGQGGMGKTTLAQLVFNDGWVSRHFNLKIWICVSSDFNVPQFKRRIIFCADNHNCIQHTKKRKKMLPVPNISEELDFILMSRLEGKKLLLVLDDVWNEDPSLWESLKAPLLAAEYARVIVTTRNVSVAEIMQTTDPVRLSYLSKENSLEILKQCAFQHHSPEKLPGLMKMGKGIVKKCGGLPLAVKTLADYIRFHHDGVEQIDDIPNEVLTEKIFPNLKVSYNHLSIQLRCCFIYCSMFPARYSFTKDELVRLWIAQGYIVDKYPIDTEGSGRKCFEKLHKSSFFDFSHCETNAVRVFTVPIFIHALAKHIAGNEYLAVDELQNIPKSVRHLYVGSLEPMRYLSPDTVMVLQTFVLSATTFCGRLDFLLDMKRLRALVLIIHNICELPKPIGNVLKPLRYLRVESHLMEKLPESIVNLCHLQVLDLSYCHKLKELPQDIGRLVNLQTLCINGCKSIQQLPTAVRDLFMLQNLYLLGSSMRWMPPVIRELTNLNRLHYRRATCFTNFDSLM